MASRTWFLTTIVAAAAVAGPNAAPQHRQKGGKTTITDSGPQTRPSFSSESELVVLHVTVKDGQGKYVAALPQLAFSIYEDNQPQPITMFTREDAPVSVGLLIDNSGSMRENRELVTAAAADFVASSNPK